MVSASTMVRVVELKKPEHYEQIRLPGGKLVRDTPPTELFNMLAKMNMDGFSHTMAKNRALDLYEQHIEAIAKAAAEKAVADYLAGSQP